MAAKTNKPKRAKRLPMFSDYLHYRINWTDHEDVKLETKLEDETPKSTDTKKKKKRRGCRGGRLPPYKAYHRLLYRLRKEQKLPLHRSDVFLTFPRDNAVIQRYKQYIREQCVCCFLTQSDFQRSRNLSYIEDMLESEPSISDDDRDTIKDLIDEAHHEFYAMYAGY